MHLRRVPLQRGHIGELRLSFPREPMAGNEPVNHLCRRPYHLPPLSPSLTRRPSSPILEELAELLQYFP